MSPNQSTAAFAEPAARVQRAQAPTPILLLCDHASNAIPPAFDALGLGPAELESHIAYDPGAAALTERMADQLDAACVLCGYSRLLIDVNRDPEAGDSIVAENDGIRVPGNQGLDAAARRQRVAQVYEPYHRAVDQLLDRRVGALGTQLVVAVHSFSPVMRGRRRPWDIGVVFDRDRRLARALAAELVGTGHRARLTLGLNEPYGPDDRVYHTVERHGEARGLPCVMLEIANDQIDTPDGRALWAGRLTQALQALLPGFAAAGRDGARTASR